jgi:hypothetical protein
MRVRWIGRWCASLVVAAAFAGGLAAHARAADFQVTTTADDGDGSLRQAILDANASDGADTITFAIGSGAVTISPLSPLPEITGPVTIDGTTQPGFVGPPLVELSGSEPNAGGIGLKLTGGSSTVRGLIVDGWSQYGIDIEGSGQNHVVGNYVGTDPTGSHGVANGTGIRVDGSSGNVIGGPDGADRNLVSGNAGGPGILIENDSLDSAASDNVVEGNDVGVDASGKTAVGNADGIVLRNVSNTTVTGNTIAANTSTGISIFVNGSQGTVVTRNAIGSLGEGLGNGTGILVASNPGPTTIGGAAADGNTIVGSVHDGVTVAADAESVTIAGNSIHDNGEQAIDLGAPDSDPTGDGMTENDPAPDADAGGNGLQNFPVLTAASSSGSSTTVSGTLTSAQTADYVLEFFANTACDDSGNGEARTPLGTATVTTNADGSASFDATLETGAAAGSEITATATDANGDTSELSECVALEGGGSTGGGGGGGTGTATVADDGAGSLTASRSSVEAGSTGNTITFTYAAPPDAGLDGGSVSVTVPDGWSAPSSSGGDAGYTTAADGSLSVSGRTITVSGVTLDPNGTLTIVYGDRGGDGPGATAPAGAGKQVWQAQEASTADGAMTDLAFSPTIAVLAAGETEPDALTPTPVTLAVQAGSSAIVPTVAHLNVAPARADIEIAIDTTGSMGPSIARAEADAIDHVDGVRAKIPDARFAVVQFRDSGDDPEYQVVQAMTDSDVAVRDAIHGLSAGGGGDSPEAYNLVFHSSYTPETGGDIGWRTGTRKFVVVIGDAEPHGAGSADFSGCADTSADPDGYSTRTELTGMRTAERTLLMLRQVASTTTASLDCYKSLAAAAFTGGAAADAGTSFSEQIADLVETSAASLRSIDLAVAPADFASWVSWSPAPPFGPVLAPADVPTTATVSVPAGTPDGLYAFTVTVSADGAPRATQQFEVTVGDPFSNLTLSADQSTVPAGVKSASIASLPDYWLAFASGAVGTPVGSTPVGSTPVGSTPVGSTPVGSTPVGSTPVGSTPVGSTPVGSTPVGSTPVGSTSLLDAPVGSTPVGSTPLEHVLLSQVPIDGGWDSILCPASPYAGRPLQTVTLADVAVDTSNCGDGTSPESRLRALPLSKTSFASTLLASVRWTSLLLGDVKLDQIPAPGGKSSWADALSSFGGDASNVDTSTNTVLGLDIAGQLGSTPVGSTPVGSTPVGSTPVGSTPVGSTAVASSRLAIVKIDDMPSGEPARGTVVDCTVVSCDDGTDATLGDAAAKGAILPTATFGTPALKPALVAAGITYNDLAVAILLRSDFPWEQLPVQGLQQAADTGKHVTYRLGVDVDCALTHRFFLSVTPPDGFFPVAGTSRIAFGSGDATTADDPVWDAKTGKVTWDGLACPEGTTGSTHVTLSFDSYAGLDLGRQTARAGAGIGRTTLVSVSGRAPVEVTQNWEPDDDPADGPTIGADTLLVGHIAASGDQDYFRLPLSQFPRGTRLLAHLSHIAPDADFDLTIQAPAAAGFFSAPVGSTPVGSTPIEDTPLGFDNSGLALPSDTLQDIPVGSTPVGSTPVGSTPVGSTSTTRGSSDETAQIVVGSGEGDATIGVTGYNGSWSDEPYVLRVQVVPPPALPPCPARTFPNAMPAPGTLPASLPTSTKTLFLVDRQRLVAMYGQADTDALLAKIGGQGQAGTLAARPEVAGAVLQVDGNAAVRAAYAAWDAAGGQCSVDAANDVVRSINDVVASYRNSTDGLPNLRYVVLLGDDVALPMARTQDPVLLSPESNEAADLAFTTSGLTLGNALYAASAQDQLLTDGAYGAFTSIPWLDRDLLLPQVSVSRLVESPRDMLGQVNLYLDPAVHGVLDPTTAVTSGYDFLSDGAAAVSQALGSDFSLLANDTLISGTWKSSDLASAFFGKSPVPAIGSLNAHYNHYELQPADASAGLLTTAAATSAIPGGILFSMGCHSGLNVPDSLGGDPAKLRDWAQAYAQAQTAVYVANSGFGYGDTDAVALSERLMALFAQKLNGDGGAIGDQWVEALHDYFDTAGAYNVYDEKVMEEATFYGLPFWHFATPGTATPPAPRATSADAGFGGTQTATVTIQPQQVRETGPDGTSYWSDGGRTHFGLSRPLQPISSTDVTASLPATGVWVDGLETADVPDVKPTLGHPTVDLSAHEPIPNVPPVFYPSSIVGLARSAPFAQEQAFVNVTGQFRPDGPGSGTGVERLPKKLTLKVLYGDRGDETAPLVTDVRVSFAGGTATIEARITDDEPIVRAAALVNDGTLGASGNVVWKLVSLSRSPDDPTLFTGSTSAARNPEVIVEGTNGHQVSYSANKGSNFTAVTGGTASGPRILIADPTGPYSPGQQVTASYSCVDAPAGSSCVGTVPNGAPLDTSTFGLHTFVVEVVAADGTVLAALQRTYVVAYAFRGFFSPIDNLPTINSAKAGSAVPVKFSLGGNQGLDIFAAGYPQSQPVSCATGAVVATVEETTTAGASSLSYSAGTDTYTYVWKTDKAWRGSCRTLVVQTKDGAVHRASFKFK